jgi:hypothetical protein
VKSQPAILPVVVDDADIGNEIHPGGRCSGLGDRSQFVGQRGCAPTIEIGPHIFIKVSLGIPVPPQAKHPKADLNAAAQKRDITWRFAVHQSTTALDESLLPTEIYPPLKVHCTRCYFYARRLTHLIS